MSDHIEAHYCVVIQDIDEVQVHYPGMLEVMRDLQGKLLSLINLVICCKVEGECVYGLFIHFRYG